MEPKTQTIQEVFQSFLSEQQTRLAPSTFARYKDVIELFAHSLNSYAYQSLQEAERKAWEKRWEADKEAGSFCNTFGPDKIPENIAEFLGYFLIRKVSAGQDLLKASGTVMRKLLKWLEENNLVHSDSIGEAEELVDDIGPELPKAEKLSMILGQLCLEPPQGRLLEEWEGGYAVIEKIEPGRLWFRDDFGGDEVVGPVIVSKGATEVAKVGWSISALYLVRTSRGWRMAEVGNVYP